ncbi:MAG: RcnB family protein [Proteobacteria bacterium]|nr:RcnB family protein [Pseudomonadota bacterium]
MRAKSFLKTGIGTTLALAMLATALPANAQERDRERGGDRREMQMPRPAERPAERAPERVAPPQRDINRTFGGNNTWSNGNQGNRPQPAWRAQAPSMPDRGQQAQGGLPQRGWDGQRWNGDGARPGVPQVQQRPAWSAQQRDNDRRDNNRWEGNNTWHRDADRRDGDRRWDNDRRDGDRRDGDHRWDNDRRDNDRWRNNDSWRRDADRRWDNHQRWDGQHRWNNDWRRDNRYNWYAWRNQNRNVFRGGYYYAPYRGYNYSRLSIGFTLGSPFYSQRYWISDPWAYRLPPAYGPYRWVRYYDDVLLVDTYSGEVVDVIYDFFW